MTSKDGNLTFLTNTLECLINPTESSLFFRIDPEELDAALLELTARLHDHERRELSLVQALA